MKYSERINECMGIDAKVECTTGLSDEIQDRLDKLETLINPIAFYAEPQEGCTIAERQFLDELKNISFIDEDGDIARRIDPGYTFLFQRHFRCKLEDVFK